MTVAEKRPKLRRRPAATTLARPMGRKKKPMPKSVARTPAGQFGTHLESLLSQAGITPDELADKLGVNSKTVRFWTKGRSTPGIDDWPAIAKSLGLDDWRKLIPPA